MERLPSKNSYGENPVTPPRYVTPCEIDENIENEIDFWIEQKHQDDFKQLEWVEEGWTE